MFRVHKMEVCKHLKATKHYSFSIGNMQLLNDAKDYQQNTWKETRYY